MKRITIVIVSAIFMTGNVAAGFWDSVLDFFGGAQYRRQQESGRLQEVALGGNQEELQRAIIKAYGPMPNKHNKPTARFGDAMFYTLFLGCEPLLPEVYMILPLDYPLDPEVQAAREVYFERLHEVHPDDLVIRLTGLINAVSQTPPSQSEKFVGYNAMVDYAIILEAAIDCGLRQVATFTLTMMREVLATVDNRNRADALNIAWLPLTFRGESVDALGLTELYTELLQDD
jgi:hypothetical protein